MLLSFLPQRFARLTFCPRIFQEIRSKIDHAAKSGKYVAAVQKLDTAFGHLHAAFAVGIPPDPIAASGSVCAYMLDVYEIEQTEMAVTATDTALFDTTPRHLW